LKRIATERACASSPSASPSAIAAGPKSNPPLAGAAFLAVAQSHGLTSAIMDSRRPEMVEGVRATDFLLGRDEWGATWIRMYRAKQAAAAT
jgi:hypothetical protein